MTRAALDLASPTLDRITLMIHGGYAVGKTYLLGDMLKTEMEKGPVKFVNIAGEDGYASIKHLALPPGVGETVETLRDAQDALAEYRKLNVPLAALGIDGGKWLYRAVMAHETGGARLPTVGGQGNEWGEIHFLADNLFKSLRYVAPVVMVTTTSDKSVEQLSGRTMTTPDLPGRAAAGMASMFDFVFYMEATPMGGGKTKRVVRTEPDIRTVVRYRTPRPPPSQIEMPDGPGGWKKLYEAIQNTYK